MNKLILSSFYFEKEKLKIRLLAFLCLGMTTLIICHSAFGQTRKLIPTNKHFYRVADNDLANQVYTLVSTHVNDSLHFYRYHDHENKIIQNVTARYKENGHFKEKITQNFDQAGNLLQVKMENLFTKTYITTYYFDEQQVAQAIHLGNGEFHILRQGDSIPQVKEKDDFSPQLNASKEEWDAFFNKNFKINGMRVKKDSQTAMIAVLVGSDGKRKEIEVANSFFVEDYFAMKALELMLKWGDNYVPALDAFGKPVEKWMYVPIHFFR